LTKFKKKEFNINSQSKESLENEDNYEHLDEISLPNEEIDDKLKNQQNYSSNRSN
jgi:hypothetical protein